MSQHESEPEQAQPPQPQPPKAPKRWPVHVAWGAGCLVALLVGIGIGAAGGDEPEPAAAEAAPGRSQDLDDREDDLDNYADILADREDDLVERHAERETELADLEADLQARATELDEREAAITQTEETIAARTVTGGVWTVGTDIEPGTYRASDVGADCYWAVLVTGTNGAEIVENGIPGGGNPQVTVEEGHDFETSRCGEWVLQ